MKILQQIEIKSTTNNVYKTIITLQRTKLISYMIFVETIYNQVSSIDTWIFFEYEKALKEYLRIAKEYAHHTVLMNL